MSIKTRTEVDVYEVDNEEVKAVPRLAVAVKSHWNRDEFIVLSIGGHEYTVVASELEAAIENGTNR